VDRWGLCNIYVFLIQVGCPSSASRWRFKKCMLATPDGWTPPNKHVKHSPSLKLDLWVLNHTHWQAISDPSYRYDSPVLIQNTKQQTKSRVEGRTSTLYVFGVFLVSSQQIVTLTSLRLSVYCQSVYSNNENNVILEATDCKLVPAWVLGGLQAACTEQPHCLRCVFNRCEQRANLMSL